EDIPLSVSRPASGGLWSRVKALLKDRVTWTGVLYLFLKFPLGIVTFTIAVTLIAVTVGFLAAPTYMWASDSLVWGSWSFDPFPWSWILTIIGIPMVFISLHLMNAIAFVFGRMTRVMLGKLQ
ncbi:MAG: sensor domain-containing protein, partial [Dehalococcoidales bacterium]